MDENNPIRVVIDAKVGRASREQVKQLAAIRGLIVDPLGRIVELPIKSNYRIGLSEFEYVTSSRGSRKGLTDTALKTADAGYLTRRLVDVAHDVIIRKDDCKTKEHLVMRRSTRSSVFGQRLLGRAVVEDVVDPKSKKVLVAKGDLVDKKNVDEIEGSDVKEVLLRSPLT